MIRQRAGWSRCAAGSCSANRVLECKVGWPQLPNEADGHFLCGREHRLHARARIQEQRQGKRDVARAKKQELLGHTVFKDQKIVLKQIRRVPA